MMFYFHFQIVRRSPCALHLASFARLLYQSPIDDSVKMHFTHSARKPYFIMGGDGMNVWSLHSNFAVCISRCSAIRSNNYTCLRLPDTVYVLYVYVCMCVRVFFLSSRCDDEFAEIVKFNWEFYCSFSRCDSSSKMAKMLQISQTSKQLCSCRILVCGVCKRVSVRVPAPWTGTI